MKFIKVLLINIFIAVKVIIAEETDFLDLCQIADRKLKLGNFTYNITDTQQLPTCIKDESDVCILEVEFSPSCLNEVTEGTEGCDELIVPINFPKSLIELAPKLDDQLLSLTIGDTTFHAHFHRCSEGYNPLAKIINQRYTHAITICAAKNETENVIKILDQESRKDDQILAVSVLYIGNDIDDVNKRKCEETAIVVEIETKFKQCSTFIIPFLDVTLFADNGGCNDRIKHMEESLEKNNFAIIHQGRADGHVRKVTNFVILTVCEISTVIFFFITLVLCFKRRPYDHTFYCGEVALYLFMIVYWWARFIVTVSLSNEYSKYHFGNKDIDIVLYVFVFIDAMLVCFNFCILIRRVWNSAIIGGNYFLSSRFAMNSLQLLLSTIPKQIIMYLYFSRLLSSYGTVPFSLSLSMWFDFVHIIFVIIFECLDLKYFWRDFQKLTATSYMSTMIIVNFIMLILEFFISFSILGATYVRQIIAVADWDKNNIYNLDRSVCENSECSPFQTKPTENFYTTQAENDLPSFFKKLPPFFTNPETNFGPRFQECLQSNLEIDPMKPECINTYELIFLSIGCIAMFFALITSYYFVATSLRNFRDIYHSFRDIDTDNDRWPLGVNRFPGGWLNNSSIIRSRQGGHNSSTDRISSDRMSFH